MYNQYIQAIIGRRRWVVTDTDNPITALVLTDTDNDIHPSEVIALLDVETTDLADLAKILKLTGLE